MIKHVDSSEQKKKKKKIKIVRIFDLRGYIHSWWSEKVHIYKNIIRKYEVDPANSFGVKSIFA